MKYLFQDPQKTSPLHLAALSGWTGCIEVLLSNNHPVDCVDAKGWSPLLYAHFRHHQQCVLALMKAKPHQARHGVLTCSLFSHVQICMLTSDPAIQ